MAVLRGLDAGLPALGAGGRGGRGGRGGGGGGGGGLPGLSTPGGRVAVTPGRGVSLPGEPSAIGEARGGNDALALLANTVLAKLDWPGRSGASRHRGAAHRRAAEALRGRRRALQEHLRGLPQEDGRGKEKLGGNLVDSAYVTAPDATAIIRILLGGKEGPIGLMPPLGATLTDDQIASALTYIRRAWGHTARRSSR